MNRSVELTPDQIRERVTDLGRWFHNMDLRGIKTAPDHMLGDYPSCKWQRFAHALPRDLRGKTVLDIGCNAGFYSIEMKRRGADRVVAVDVDDRYLRQGQVSAGVVGIEIEIRKGLGFKVDLIFGPFYIVFFLGLFLHFRYLLFALDK